MDAFEGHPYWYVAFILLVLATAGMGLQVIIGRPSWYVVSIGPLAEELTKVGIAFLSMAGFLRLIGTHDVDESDLLALMVVFAGGFYAVNEAFNKTASAFLVRFLVHTITALAGYLVYERIGEIRGLVAWVLTAASLHGIFNAIEKPSIQLWYLVLTTAVVTSFTLWSRRHILRKAL